MNVQANELRIGNLSSNGVVISISRNHIQIKDDHENIHYDFNPIPLTEEWLLKFGFIDNNYTMDLKSKSKSLTAKWHSKVISTGVRNGWYFKKYRHIKYVHQLQNLYLALTGEELTIKDNGSE